MKWKKVAGYQPGEERDEARVALVMPGGPDGHCGENGQEQEQDGSIHGKLLLDLDGAREDGSRASWHEKETR